MFAQIVVGSGIGAAIMRIVEARLIDRQRVGDAKELDAYEKACAAEFSDYRDIWPRVAEFAARMTELGSEASYTLDGDFDQLKQRQWEAAAQAYEDLRVSLRKARPFIDATIAARVDEILASIALMRVRRHLTAAHVASDEWRALNESVERIAKLTDETTTLIQTRMKQLTGSTYSPVV
jgi:hypothetical protein